MSSDFFCFWGVDSLSNTDRSLKENVDIHYNFQVVKFVSRSQKWSIVTSKKEKFANDKNLDNLINKDYQNLKYWTYI